MMKNTLILGVSFLISAPLALANDPSEIGGAPGAKIEKASKEAAVAGEQKAANLDKAKGDVTARHKKKRAKPDRVLDTNQMHGQQDQKEKAQELGREQAAQDAKKSAAQQSAMTERAAAAKDQMKEKAAAAQQSAQREAAQSQAKAAAAQAEVAKAAAAQAQQEQQKQAAQTQQKAAAQAAKPAALKKMAK